MSGADDGDELVVLVAAAPERELSLPKSVAAFGGLDLWNQQPALAAAQRTIDAECTAQTLADAQRQVSQLIDAGEDLRAYAYMRQLVARDYNLGYATVLAQPSKLLPIVYTPTVGVACQSFGKLPQQRRGLYLSVEDRGNFAAVLREYAEAELEKDDDGRPVCQCMVFSDGGRILGLGDLGAWGMGIPCGKLDLYTVCGGFHPQKTVPVIIDAGCGDPVKNTANLTIRDHEMYTGSKQDRITHKSSAGTEVNTAYYGEGSVINEFMAAAGDLFGRECLLQFEDFNSNDAFPLLAEYRDKYLCYNDDIQGTAAVTVAGLLGAVKLRDPGCRDLIGRLREQKCLFHGVGAANLGAISLLATEGGLSHNQMFITNSRGLIWKDGADGTRGNFRNAEQAEYGFDGEPPFPHGRADLASMIYHLRPQQLIGAVGVAPGCFSREVIEAMAAVNDRESPVIFALSNPKTQAEITAEDCYSWSNGRAIYGSGTAQAPVEIDGEQRHPGQVNNVYIFPGMSFGAVACAARSIPDRLFLVAAEAVAQSLSDEDIRLRRVIPSRDRLREVNLNVATAVVVEAQRMGLATKNVGATAEDVQATLSAAMWRPALEDPSRL